MQHIRPGGSQSAAVNAIRRKGQQLIVHIRRPVDLLDLVIGGGFDTVYPASAQQLHDQTVQIFCTGTNDNLPDFHLNAPIPCQILPDGTA